MKKKWILAVCAVAGLALLSACSPKVDENRDLEEIRQEAANLSESSLKRYSDAYEETIDKLEDRMEADEKALSDIPLLDRLKEPANELRGRIADVAAQMEKLRIRKAIYDSYRKKD